MKRFFRKYPKRILITLLVVLLVAIIGTVNNYSTYRSSTYTIRVRDRTGDRTVERAVDETLVKRVMKRLDDIYPAEDLAVKKEGHFYYKDIDLQPSIGSSNWCVELTLDAEEYRYNDTVTVTVKNANAKYVELYADSYILQMQLNGWYSLHTGSFAEKSDETLIHLENGESYTFEIPLEYISEVKEGPIKLEKGEYRICIYAANAYMRTGYLSHNWYTCEFEIK